MSATDTIYALSSGSLPSGIAVVRVSGQAAFAVLKQLAGRLPEPRRATVMMLRDREGADLDQALVITFAEMHSFTGEAVVELQLHGGRAVVQSVLDAIAGLPNTRPAEAGEFTRRAFVNGRMDLTAAEGVGDLIAAETEAQRRLALSSAMGAQQVLYQSWRAQLIDARALIEADLDFADEGDIPGSVAESVFERVEQLRQAVADHLSSSRSGEIIRDGYRVVIAGEPNSGKSSLINALAERDVAIVTDEPGTTRDILEVALDLNGYKIVVADTAGLRETDSKVEAIGIERAHRAMERADLVLHLHPAGQQRPELAVAAQVVEVASKADVSVAADGLLGISVKSGEGIGTLLARIGDLAQSAASHSGVIPTRHRQTVLLGQTLANLRALQEDAPLEIQAEYLRLAADSLGRVTGAIGVEDLLDVIFSRFCIGK